MVQTIGRSAFLRADRGKMMKKWLKWWTGLLCAAVLMLGASVTVLAAEMGSITVEGAVEGVDYSIYRIFDLESFSSEGGGTGRYAYKPVSYTHLTMKTGSCATLTPCPQCPPPIR